MCPVRTPKSHPSPSSGGWIGARHIWPALLDPERTWRCSAKGRRHPWIRCICICMCIYIYVDMKNYVIHRYIIWVYIYIYVCIYSIYMDIWYRLKIDQRKIQTGSPAKIVAKCGKWLRFPWREIYTVTYRNDGPLVVFGTKEVECNLWGGTPKMKCQTYVIYDGRSCDTEAISLNR